MTAAAIGAAGFFTINRRDNLMQTSEHAKDVRAEQERIDRGRAAQQRHVEVYERKHGKLCHACGERIPFDLFFAHLIMAHPE